MISDIKSRKLVLAYENPFCVRWLETYFSMYQGQQGKNRAEKLYDRADNFDKLLKLYDAIGAI